MSFSSDDAKLPALMQEAIDWLVRLRSDDMSEAETHAFADWLSQDIFHTEAFAKAEDLFNNMVIAARLPQSITANHDSKDNQPIQRFYFQKHRCWLGLPLALAAAWLFAVGLVVPKQSHFLDDYFSDYHTSTGEMRDIQLADGSRLLLNTNTAVSVDFQASLRQITLHHGQARFTVTKDTQRPFEVKSDELIIRALGTIFEVYNQEPGRTSVTVQEHAVAARTQPNGQTPAQEGQASKVQVQKGQQLRYDGNGSLGLPEPVDLSRTSAWQQRRLFINDRPLAELIAELDRYRVGRIFLSDAQLKNLHITGVFTLDKPDEVLNKVRKVLALKETHLGSWWVLLHR